VAGQLEKVQFTRIDPLIVQAPVAWTTNPATVPLLYEFDRTTAPESIVKLE
jgi:hypothetical protein